MTNQVKTKSNKMEEVFSLWRKTGKNGTHYFTGKGIVGFYQTNKEKPKSHDLLIYNVNEEGNVVKPSILSLWVQLSKDKKTQYLTGKYEGRRVVGFINKDAAEGSKKPYLSIYYSDDTRPQETPEELDIKSNKELPF